MTTPVVKTMVSGSRKLVVNITGIFATSDAANVVVIDRSGLIGPDGTVPEYIKVDEITWSIFDFDYVLLKWDEAGGDETIEYLSGQGYMDYRPYGGKSPANIPGVATDGDIQLTTANGAADGTFSILLHCTLKT